MSNFKKATTKLAEAGVFWLMLPSSVLAQSPLEEGVESAKPSGVPEEGLFEPGGIFQRVVNTVIFLVGAIAVLMLIIGGIRYVISAGDENAVKGAKNTILYAIVGIVVALLAFAAVQFIIGRLSGS